MQTGTIFNIQPFSVYDGPGIRTTVFLKGCNLRCAWCHNPESWSAKPQIQYLAEKCIGCQSCAQACGRGVHRFADGVHSLDRSACIGCGRCADSCFTGALVLTGKPVTTDDVMERLLEDRLYFENSGGGVTFSGGECMMQLPFLAELLQRCHQAGIHTAVDTAGYVPFSQFEKILPDTDLFLYDIKAFTPETHKKLTGVENGRILQNLQLLLERGAEVIIRIPCIPGGNWDELSQVAAFLQGLPVRQVELLAYHRLGEGKRQALGMACESFTQPSAAEMEQLLGVFLDHHIPAVYNR